LLEDLGDGVLQGTTFAGTERLNRLDTLRIDSVIKSLEEKIAALKLPPGEMKGIPHLSQELLITLDI
jgi:hypothetical protein